MGKRQGEILGKIPVWDMGKHGILGTSKLNFLAAGWNVFTYVILHGFQK